MISNGERLEGERARAVPLAFVVAAGPEVGMGHLMRSTALACAARDRGHPVCLYLEGDLTAQRIWRDQLGADAPCLVTQASSPGEDGAVRGMDGPGAAHRPSGRDLATGSPPMATLIDLPPSRDEAKAAWLARLREDAVTSVVLDDDRWGGEADLTLCPALHHSATPPDHFAGPSDRYLGGPAYAILSDVHRETGHLPLAARRSLLLSIGGADPHGMTPLLAPVIERALAPSTPGHDPFEREVVLGPAFQDPEGCVAARLADRGWRVHRALAPRAMAALMARSRLAVMGFGTSLTELAWHGTPHLSITHRAEDDGAARLLEQRGIGRHLGCAARLDLARVETRLRRAIADPAWQRTSAARAHSAIDHGRGSDRILERIVRQALAPRSRQATGSQSTPGRYAPGAGGAG